MTSPVLRRVLSFLTVLICCLTVSAGEKQRIFGPEWKKVGSDYERTVSATVRHGQGVANFAVPLECRDTVNVSEIDDDLGFDVRIVSNGRGELYGGFEVSKSGGRPTNYTLRAGPNLYYDLDADGMIDAMCDKREGRFVAMILLDGRFVPVADQKSLFRCAPGETLKVLSADRKEQYEFTKGQWRSPSMPRAPGVPKN